MRKLDLEKLTIVNGTHEFHQLTIDDTGQLDLFEKSLESKYLSEITTIKAYMDFVANNCPLPHTKFKDLTPDKELIKEYEFKSKHLRVYAVHVKTIGKIIVLCGYKNNQKKDLVEFRSLKKQLLNSIGLL